MANNESSPTKTMFDCLVRLYKQSQLLLMDADRIMGEKNWEPTNMLGPAQLSNSLNSPERWYARWAVRFYNQIISEENKANIDKLLFVSIQFASDHSYKVEDPVVSAGWLLYSKPMTKKEADNNYYYWMCLY